MHTRTLTHTFVYDLPNTKTIRNEIQIKPKYLIVICINKIQLKRK